MAHDDLKLGQLITEPRQRDAIHVAVAPVTAAERLLPGMPCGLAGTRVNPIGIVDPFLKDMVEPAQEFWLFLYPNTITSLRHDWTHPAFEAGRISQDDHAAKSNAWIENHAKELGLTADVLMENAESWLEYGEHFVQHDSQRWRDNFNSEEFWHHYEIVTQKAVPADKKHSFYCCTC